jgi:hypothetical protein
MLVHQTVVLVQSLMKVAHRLVSVVCCCLLYHIEFGLHFQMMIQQVLVMLLQAAMMLKQGLGVGPVLSHCKRFLPCFFREIIWTLHRLHALSVWPQSMSTRPQ